MDVANGHILNIDAMENVIDFLRNHATYDDTRIIVEQDTLIGFFKTVSEEKRRAQEYMARLQSDMAALEKRNRYLVE